MLEIQETKHCGLAQSLCFAKFVGGASAKMKVQPEVLVPKSEQQQSIMPVFASLYSVLKR